METIEKSDATEVVAFFDLRPSHAPIHAAILSEIDQLLADGTFTNGPHVAAFEAAFATWSGAAHCVGLANGLDGLRLALIALGIGPGDEVVVPANTFAATLEAVIQSGARPVLADASPTDYNLDADAARTAVGPATAALLPVHLYGQMADMVAIGALAAQRGLAVVEDACQSHGATREGVRAGCAGDAAAFSFYPAKNLGAFGDAGAFVTSRPELADTVRALREHGQRRKYHHELIGYTARLDTLQALVLLHKLPLLDGWNAEREALAASYSAALEGIGDLQLPPVADRSRPVWHLYVVRTAAPEGLGEFLAGRGIGTGRHYPEPLHLMPAFADLGYRKGDFPVAEALASECLSLPLFPGMTTSQVDRVTEAIAAYFERG